jgi:hypothetical protein
MTKFDLIMRAFKVFKGWSGPACDSLWWRTDDEYAPLTLIVNCNDLFYWGTADCVVLDENNIDLLEKTVEDMKAIDPDNYTQADLLFCCRVRKMRPQIPYYKYIDEQFYPLFNACGPERDKNGF